MARANDHVERVLLEFSDLLAIVGERRASRLARTRRPRARWAVIHADVADLDDDGVRAIPNVGRSIAVEDPRRHRRGHVP